MLKHLAEIVQRVKDISGKDMHRVVNRLEAGRGMLLHLMGLVAG